MLNEPQEIQSTGVPQKRMHARTAGRTSDSRGAKGFIIVFALVILVTLTILVISAMSQTTMGERMAGSHMDRARAQLTAELALTNALTDLQANGEACALGCASVANTGIAAAALSMPTAWSSTLVGISGTAGTTQYVVQQLPSGYDEGVCKAYSMMGKGVGIQISSVVVLQQVAYVCPN